MERTLIFLILVAISSGCVTQNPTNQKTFPIQSQEEKINIDTAIDCLEIKNKYILVADSFPPSSNLEFNLKCNGSLKEAYADVKLLYQDQEHISKSDKEKFSGNLTFRGEDVIIDFEPREIQLNSSKTHRFSSPTEGVADKAQISISKNR